jgi:hypothetical protein
VFIPGIAPAFAKSAALLGRLDARMIEMANVTDLQRKREYWRNVVWAVRPQVQKRATCDDKIPAAVSYTFSSSSG